MTNQPREPNLHDLLNQFESIGGPEEFGPEGVAIMVALWRKSSKLNGLDKFTMTNTELQVQTGIQTRKTLNAYRSKLIEAGIIKYESPPNGSSRGTYHITFNLLEPFKPVTEPDPIPVTSGYSFLVPEPKPVTSGNSFGTTVLKDLDLISSSSAAAKYSESEFIEMVKAIENHFVIKRNLGFGINVDDEKAMRQALADGIPLKTITKTIDACFKKYKSRHQHDRIRTFTYCVPSIYDAWVKEQSITEPVEPVALGGSITENVPSEPVALGSTRKTKHEKQMEMLDQIAREEQECGQSGS